MPGLVYAIVGVLFGFVLGYYWLSRSVQNEMAESKTLFEERQQHLISEIKSANQDNQELRDRLVELQLEHQQCGPDRIALEKRLIELDNVDVGRRDDEVTSRIVELELQLRREKQRRHALRQEFEKIEQQLVGSGLGAKQLGGESLSLHEAPQAFDHEEKPVISPLEGQAGVEFPSETESNDPIPLLGPDSTLRDENTIEMQELDGGDVEAIDSIGDHQSLQVSKERNEEEPPQTDDLKLIKGIGPVLERKLHAMGIETFSQVASFSDLDIARIDSVLNFKGRIGREKWVEQARNLNLQKTS